MGARHVDIGQSERDLGGPGRPGGQRVLRAAGEEAGANGALPGCPVSPRRSPTRRAVVATSRRGHRWRWRFAGALLGAQHPGPRVIALFIAVSLDPAVRWLVQHGMRRPSRWRSSSCWPSWPGRRLLAAVGPPLVRAGRQAQPSDLPGYVDGPHRTAPARSSATCRPVRADRQLIKRPRTLPGKIGGERARVHRGASSARSSSACS